MSENPFKGMYRQRLPFLHMITAINGQVPLKDALAAFFFVQLHDKVEHNCLLAGGEGSPAEEWSYLPFDDAYPFILIAEFAAEQVQRWISEGVHEPIEIVDGPLVERPDWAVRRYEYLEGVPEDVQEARDLVAKLREEIAAPGADQD